MNWRQTLKNAFVQAGIVVLLAAVLVSVILYTRLDHPGQPNWGGSWGDKTWGR